MCTLDAWIYTRMADGGGDSVRFTAIADRLGTPTGIVNYYSRMNRTSDTIRGHVAFYQTNTRYPVMGYKVRKP